MRGDLLLSASPLQRGPQEGWHLTATAATDGQ